MPTEIKVEIRVFKNSDGTYNAASFQDNNQLGAEYSVKSGEYTKIIELKMKLSQVYPQDVAIDVIEQN